MTPLVIYFLWNDGDGPSILKELQQILGMVSQVLLGGEQMDIPPIALHKQIQEIPGQVTTDFQNLSFRVQLAWQAWHVEVEKWHVATLLNLVVVDFFMVGEVRTTHTHRTHRLKI